MDDPFITFGSSAVFFISANEHKLLKKHYKMVDKFEVKGLISNLIGESHVIPTLGVWDNFDDINFDTLPDKFVLKTTNGGGSSGVVICLDQQSFDKELAKKKLELSMSNDIYKGMGEWVYKGIKHRILAETYMFVKDSINSAGLTDYKFFCFNGEPRYCQVIRDRNFRQTIDFYDMNWQHQDFIGLNPAAINGSPVIRPYKLDRMIGICRILSKCIPFVRIDLYDIDGSVYFGEMTFYPASGYGVISPDEWNYNLGSLLNLPK